MKIRSHNQKERGGVFVEAALILLLFIITMVAIVDFGQFLFFHQSLSERVRMAARYGALHWDNGCNAQCVTNLVVYNRPFNIPDGARSLVPNLQTSNVLVTMPAPNTQGMEARVTVEIRNYTFRVFTPMLASRGSMVSRPIVSSAPIEAPN